MVRDGPRQPQHGPLNRLGSIPVDGLHICLPACACPYNRVEASCSSVYILACCSSAGTGDNDDDLGDLAAMSGGGPIGVPAVQHDAGAGEEDGQLDEYEAPEALEVAHADMLAHVHDDDDPADPAPEDPAPDPPHEIDWQAYSAHIVYTDGVVSDVMYEGRKIGQLQPMPITGMGYSVAAVRSLHSVGSTRCDRMRSWRHRTDETPDRVDQVLVKWLIDGLAEPTRASHRTVPRE